MSTKQEILEMLAKIPDDEPLFLLRGQDELALQTVLGWICNAIDRDVNLTKTMEALACCRQMKIWQPKKLPD